MSEYLTIRLTIEEGDSFDFRLKPFHKLTTAEHIRIYEEVEDENTLYLWPTDKAKALLKRISGAPDRYIRYLSIREVEAIMAKIAEMNRENDRLHNAVSRVKETLEQWEKEHDGQPWTLEDAIAVLQDHSMYCTEITVNGRTYTAPNIEEAASFGQWIDLQAAMSAEEKGTEGSSYVRALAIMMAGPDGHYPVQSNDESDSAYSERTAAYTRQRHADFMAAPFIQVLGAASFFFSRSSYFAAICAHNMSSLLALLPQPVEPVRRALPSDGGPMLN